MAFSSNSDCTTITESVGVKRKISSIEMYNNTNHGAVSAVSHQVSQPASQIWGTKHNKDYEQIMNDKVYFHKQSYMSILLDNKNTVMGFCNVAVGSPTGSILNSINARKNSLAYVFSNNAENIPVDFLETLLSRFVEKLEASDDQNITRIPVNKDDMKVYTLGDLICLYTFHELCMTNQGRDIYHEMKAVLLPQPYTVSYATGKTDTTSSTTLLSLWNLRCMAMKYFYMSSGPAYQYTVFTTTSAASYLQRLCLVGKLSAEKTPFASDNSNPPRPSSQSAPEPPQDSRLIDVVKDYHHWKVKNILVSNTALSSVKEIVASGIVLVPESPDFLSVSVENKSLALSFNIDVLMITLRALLNSTNELYENTMDEFV